MYATSIDSFHFSPDFATKTMPGSIAISFHFWSIYVSSSSLSLSSVVISCLSVFSIFSQFDNLTSSSSTDKRLLNSSCEYIFACFQVRRIKAPKSTYEKNSSFQEFFDIPLFPEVKIRTLSLGSNMVSDRASSSRMRIV